VVALTLPLVALGICLCYLIVYLWPAPPGSQEHICPATPREAGGTASLARAPQAAACVSLLRRAGYRVERLIPTAGLCNMVEAVRGEEKTNAELKSMCSAGLHSP
jgi:hypothetical protein